MKVLKTYTFVEKLRACYLMEYNSGKTGSTIKRKSGTTRFRFFGLHKPDRLFFVYQDKVAVCLY